MSTNEAPQGSYCASPWFEGVLYHNGDLKTCCHSISVLGNWQQEGLGEAWHSQKYQDFRKKIIQGEFPEDNCRRCWSNRTVRKLSTGLTAPFELYQEVVFEYFGKESGRISALQKLFDISPLDIAPEQLASVLSGYFNKLEDFFREGDGAPSDVTNALEKLKTIGTITQAFLERNPSPPVVAPYREVQIISRCNARCLPCVGTYTGRTSDGPALDQRYIPEAFSHAHDVINFFHNSSELLFYKGWKEITNKLVEAGVKTTLFTNTILLTPANIDFLIDNRVLLRMNVSVDGATKETVEAIRRNVNFDHMERNLTYLFEYAEKKRVYFPISFSFLLMKKNYRELPAFVRFVERMRGASKNLPCKIAVQILAQADVAGYREFYRDQHPALLDQGELKKIFADTLVESKRTNIPVSFAASSLDAFIAQGCPVPRMSDPLELIEQGKLDRAEGLVALGTGWYDVEMEPVPSRWVGEQMTMLCHWNNTERRRLYVTMIAFHKPRMCRITLNDVETMRELIPLEPKVLSVDLDFKKGENVIQIESLDGAESPSEIEELHSPDPRRLAFHFRGMEIV